MPEMLTIKGVHVGEQFIHSGEDLTFCRQMGVEYVGAYFPLRRNGRELSLEEEDYWSADTLARSREHVESFGLKLAAIHLPLSSMDIAKNPWSSIMLGHRSVTVTLSGLASTSRQPGRQGFR